MAFCLWYVHRSHKRSACNQGSCQRRSPSDTEVRFNRLILCSACTPFSPRLDMSCCRGHPELLVLAFVAATRTASGLSLHSGWLVAGVRYRSGHRRVGCGVDLRCCSYASGTTRHGLLPPVRRVYHAHQLPVYELSCFP
jgi:hypothetical protein